MTHQEEVQALIKQWKEEGWSDGEIQTSLISYFEDSQTFEDDND